MFVWFPDAQRVLQQGQFTLEDAHLTVTEMIVDDNTKHQTTGPQHGYLFYDLFI